MWKKKKVLWEENKIVKYTCAQNTNIGRQEGGASDGGGSK